MNLDRASILEWLREDDPHVLEVLWDRADATRRKHVGEQVHLRGLIEISSYCVRQCMYCGLRAPRGELQRYRMTPDEIFAAASAAQNRGYGTVVLQAGEDPRLTADFIARVVRRIKTRTTLAVTLSLGERNSEELKWWKDAGADRYLLRFETSNRDLYDRIHPPHNGRSDRIEILRALKSIGYETGSGIMIGIPGQRFDDVANDLLLFRELDLDMIGVGPFIAHPSTPLGRGEIASAVDPREQVPNSELMVYKVVALTRLLRPDANIPSTTALATINKTNGRELGLARGANVVMPNLTPPNYRAMYEIYPGKACVNETAEKCDGCLKGRIARMGRTVGVGAGGRRRMAS